MIIREINHYTVRATSGTGNSITKTSKAFEEARYWAKKFTEGTNRKVEIHEHYHGGTSKLID